MVVSPQTRGSSASIRGALYGTRIQTPSIAVYPPPSEILMLLSGVLMGGYQLDPLLLLKGPKAIGHCQSPDHVGNLISLLG